MKRTLAFLLTLTMVFSLCACGGTGAKKQELFESFAWGTSMKEVEDALTAEAAKKKSNIYYHDDYYDFPSLNNDETEEVQIDYSFKTLFSSDRTGYVFMFFDSSGDAPDEYPLVRIVVSGDLKKGIDGEADSDALVSLLLEHYGAPLSKTVEEALGFQGVGLRWVRSQTLIKYIEMKGFSSPDDRNFSLIITPLGVNNTSGSEAAPEPTASEPEATPEPTAAPEPAPTPEPTAAPVMTEAQIALPSGTETLPVRIWYCEDADFTVCLPGIYAPASDFGSGDSQSLFLWTKDMGDHAFVMVKPANYPDLSSVSEDRLNSLMQSYLDWEKGMDYKDLGHRVLETQDAVWLWAAYTYDKGPDNLEVWTFLNGHRITFCFGSFDGAFTEDDLALCEWAVRSFRLGKYSEVPA